MQGSSSRKLFAMVRETLPMLLLGHRYRCSALLRSGFVDDHIAVPKLSQ
jgi:hypothetical protein